MYYLQNIFDWSNTIDWLIKHVYNYHYKEYVSHFFHQSKSYTIEIK